MLFKKLIAPKSTKKCMLKYAYRKGFCIDDDDLTEDEMEEAIEKVTFPIIGRPAIEYVLDAVDEIYTAHGM
jgi:hypothetical protein